MNTLLKKKQNKTLNMQEKKVPKNENQQGQQKLEIRPRYQKLAGKEENQNKLIIKMFKDIKINLKNRRKNLKNDQRTK